MKSAYELAMERLGGAQKYTDAQKKKFADIDKACDADVAQAKFSAETQLKKIDPQAGDAEALREEVAAHLATDLARIERKREKKKEEVRSAK